MTIDNSTPVELEIDLSDVEPKVNQVEFKEGLLDTLQEYLEDTQLVVTDIRNNSITIKTDDGEEVVNIGDDIDLELALIIMIIIANFQLSSPVIDILLGVDDEEGEVLMEGVVLSDFTGPIFSKGCAGYEGDSELSVNLSARYLFNQITSAGLVKFDFADNANREILTNDVEVHTSDSGLADEEFLLKGESLANPTTGSIAREQREKAIRRKKLKLNRLKDPAAAKARSKAAKLRWRKNRAKMIRGMKKFNRSAEGKKLNRVRGKKLAIIRSQND